MLGSLRPPAGLIRTNSAVPGEVEGRFRKGRAPARAARVATQQITWVEVLLGALVLTEHQLSPSHLGHKNSSPALCYSGKEVA